MFSRWPPNGAPKPNGGAPKLSVQQFLADPKPLPPSPRGPLHSGNVEMWPPPNCQDVLPPVGASSMPAMPAMPAMPGPSGPSGPSPPAPAMPSKAGPAPSPASASASAMPTPGSRPAPSPAASSAPSHTAGKAEPPPSRWAMPAMPWARGGTAEGRRGSMGMPALPVAASIPIAHATPVAPEPVEAVPISTTSTLPPSWEAALSIQAPEEEAEGGTAELVEDLEAVELDPEDNEEEETREDLVNKLKVARKALLWERATKQRLRSQLDMAEAWSTTDDAAQKETEAKNLQATLASLMEENQRLQEKVEMQAGAEAEQLRRLLRETEEASTAAATGEAEASAEAEQLRRLLRETEDETATAIRAAVGDLRAKLQEEAAATDATAGAEAQQMRDRLRHVEDETATAIKAAVGDLREKLKTAEEASAAASMGQAEASAETQQLRRKLRDTEDETATAIRAAVGDLRAKLQEEAAATNATAGQAEAAAAATAAAASAEAAQMRDRLKHVEDKTAADIREAVGDLRARLQDTEEHAAASEHREEELRAQLLALEASAKAGAEAEEEALRLRTVERSAEESQQECEDLRAQLRAMEAGAKAGEAAEEEALRLRTVERSAEESQQECQDLRAQLRKMEAGAKTGPDEEEAQRRLRKAERSVEESEQECQGLQARLRHREKAETQLVLEVEDLRSRLKKASAQEVGHVGVQTDTESHHVTFEKRKTRKSVFFNTEGKQPLPGGVDDDEKPTGRVRSARSDRMKSVDFGGKDSSVSYVPESSEDEGGSEVPVSASTSMFSQVSEYYDTYNETSQPVRNRTRSTIESYSEEDLWDPEHVAMVTRKLFPKHDKNGTNRIEWSSGEAIAFLEEFFWLHKQPPPKIAKAAFHSLYSQVKTENSGYDYTATDEGLNVEEMTSFAMKVHQFIYKQLGKEMREQRKSFAVSEEDMKTLHRASVEMALGEDATSVLARMTRRTTIVAPPDTSLLG